MGTGAGGGGRERMQPGRSTGARGGSIRASHRETPPAAAAASSTTDVPVPEVYQNTHYGIGFLPHGTRGVTREASFIE